MYRDILRFLLLHRNSRFIEGWTVLIKTTVIVHTSIYQYILPKMDTYKLIGRTKLAADLFVIFLKGQTSMYTNW